MNDERPHTAPAMTPRWKRRLLALILGASAFAFCWVVWEPGKDVVDGTYDLRRNGLWLQHGWLGDDAWFVRYNKTNGIDEFRSRAKVRLLRASLDRYGVIDVFPHVAPTDAIRAAGLSPVVGGVEAGNPARETGLGGRLSSSHPVASFPRCSLGGALFPIRGATSRSCGRYDV